MKRKAVAEDLDAKKSKPRKAPNAQNSNRRKSPMLEEKNKNDITSEDDDDFVDKPKSNNASQTSKKIKNVGDHHKAKRGLKQTKLNFESTKEDKVAQQEKANEKGQSSKKTRKASAPKKNETNISEEPNYEDSLNHEAATVLSENPK